MKSYLSLTTLSAKIRRRQNRMTILCIVIAVFLVTSVFSMADMGVRMEKERAISKHGNWHVTVHDFTPEQAQEIAAQNDVAAVSRYDVVNYKINEDYYFAKHKLSITGADAAFLTDIFYDFSSITEGKVPRARNDIMLSENAAEIADVNVGDSITVQTPNGALGYTVSGFMNLNSAREYDAIVGMIPYETFKAQFSSKEPELYIQFKESFNLRDSINTLKQTYHFSDEQVSENTALLGIVGQSSNSFIMQLYMVAGMLFLLVLFAGILMIASSINSNVAQRTQFFGMLRCIGASQKQVMRLVRMEALNWCKVALPTGVSLGIAATWGLCAILHYVVGGEFAMIPVFGISAVGIIFGIITGMLAVLLAARTPAKRAARVSPIAAVSGNVRQVGNHKQRVQGFSTNIALSLGRSHAMGAKKTWLLMTVSFALSIVLFLSFSVPVSFVQHALTPLRPYAPDISLLQNERNNTLDAELIEKIQTLSGVEHVFGRKFVGNVAVQNHSKASNVDVISYDDLQLGWAEADVVEGDIHAIEHEKDVVMTVHAKKSESKLNVGDTLTINGQKVTVGCILSDSPFESNETPMVICNEATFEKLFGNQGYAVIDLQVNDAFNDGALSALRGMIDSDTSLSDRRENNRDITATYWAFSFVVYSFLAIVATITIVHVMNSISMSVSARIKEYGAMRAIGMDKSQFTRMIASEAATYGASGCLVGCAAGLPLHYEFYHLAITDYWGDAWQLPIIPLIVILALIVFTTVVAVYGPVRRIWNNPITETINEL